MKKLNKLLSCAVIAVTPIAFAVSVNAGVAEDIVAAKTLAITNVGLAAAAVIAVVAVVVGVTLVTGLLKRT